MTLGEGTIGGWWAPTSGATVIKGHARAWARSRRGHRMDGMSAGDPTAVTVGRVRAALGTVVDPELGASITDLGMVRDVELDGPLVRVRLALTTTACPLQDQIGADIAAALAGIDGLDRVEVHTEQMDPDALDRLGRQVSLPFPALPAPRTEILAIGSGKGGVGKSTLTVNLACALAAAGARVGIIDADVWGFSVLRLLGAHGEAMGVGDKLLPLQAHGVKVVSVGMFVDEDDPVVWRGPMLHEAIEQFVTGVAWGPLDVLLVDLPPGTGDAALSLAKAAPGARFLLVTTPQQAASRVAARAGAMARKAGLTLAGVVENMSAGQPAAGTAPPLFDGSGGDDLAGSLGVPLLGRIPALPAVAAAGDAGVPLVVSDPDGVASRQFRAVAEGVLPGSTRGLTGSWAPLRRAAS